MTKLINHILYPFIVVYYFIYKRKKKISYFYFKQLARNKYFKWQWKILNKIMGVKK